MQMYKGCFVVLLGLLLRECSTPVKQVTVPVATADSAYKAGYTTTILTGSTTPQQLLNYACSLEGIRYKYASTDPKEGFDCSGFVTYVFNHFDIAVPRSSFDFTPVNHPIDIKDAKAGDLILFTGTDSTDRKVGHMGIISSIPSQPLAFIHSTSGHNKGVVETMFTPYYRSRFVKVVRIFPQNDK